jgi:hypothetical protein
MTQSASQISAFFVELVASQSIYLIKNASGAILLLRGDDRLVMPIWSSISRCEQFMQYHPGNSQFATVCVEWDDFDQRWLKDLEKKKVKVGLNWCNQPGIFDPHTILSDQEFRLAMQYLDQQSLTPNLYTFVMSKDEQRLFDRVSASAHYYLEFGMGGSTLRMIGQSRAQIYSVDSSLDWVDHMRRYRSVREAELSRLHLVPIDIGPVGDWGYPMSNTNRARFADYSAKIFDIVDSAKIDVALVDGRFRVACVLKLVLHCGAGHPVKILIHDFWNRPHYHLVLRYLETLEKVDTLGLFRIKDEIDLAELEADYLQYMSNPK